MAEIKATNTTPLSNRKKKIRKIISLGEIEERRSKGICLFCDEPETPNHYRRHKNSGIRMIEGDEDQFHNDKMEFESEVGETDSSNHVELIHQLEFSDCAENSTPDILETMSVPKLELIHTKMMETESETDSIMESNCVHHTNLILQHQVPISSLEYSLNFCKPSCDAIEDCQYVIGRTHQTQSHSNFGSVKADVCQVFDVVPMRRKVLSKRRKKMFHKSWKFKFKHRVAPEYFKSGFEVKGKQNACLFLSNNRAVRVHSLFDGEMKFNGYKLFCQLLLSVINKRHQKKKRKGSKSWKFKFKPAKKDIKQIKPFLGNCDEIKKRSMIIFNSIKGTKFLCSRRLVVYKRGSDAKTIAEMYQRVDQLIKLECAKVKRMLEVTQSQIFDPGIRHESQGILRSYVPSSAETMALDNIWLNLKFQLLLTYGCLPRPPESSVVGDIGSATFSVADVFNSIHVTTIAIRALRLCFFIKTEADCFESTNISTKTAETVASKLYGSFSLFFRDNFQTLNLVVKVLQTWEICYRE